MRFAVNVNLNLSSSYNTCHISWDSSGIFCPLNVGFLRVATSSKKINTGREGAQLFVGIWVQRGVSQLNVMRIVDTEFCGIL